MLWLETVIGTALWCWWQVPARRYQRRVGTLRAWQLDINSDITSSMKSIRDTNQEK
jgi:hypothetical protein